MFLNVRTLNKLWTKEKEMQQEVVHVRGNWKDKDAKTREGTLAVLTRHVNEEVKRRNDENWMLVCLVTHPAAEENQNMDMHAFLVFQKMEPLRRAK